ncbi:MAG: carbohydate-binding domain-containing protein, partial [Bacteroidetes bacterium]|nr:carbohydate-binding domain-containing protein [Bacteroidota bacterium]
MRKILFALLSITLFASCADEETTASTRPTGADIEILYEMLGNRYQSKNQYMNEFVIQNHSKFELSSNWTIYFHQPYRLIDNSVKGPVTINHISGDYYKIEPSKEYVAVKPEGEMQFSFLNRDAMIKNADFPCGFYIVFKDSLGVESLPETISEITYGPLIKAEQLSRAAGDSVAAPTAESRFAA